MSDLDNQSHFRFGIQNAFFSAIAKRFNLNNLLIIVKKPKCHGVTKNHISPNIFNKKDEISLAKIGFIISNVLLYRK